MDECTKGTDCCQNNTVEEQDVMQYIQDVQIMKMGNKSTVVCATLKNGFEIVESSACVDPANYCHETGTEVAMKKVHTKVWELLGFDLQNQLCAKAKGECCTPDETCKETEGGCAA